MEGASIFEVIRDVGEFVKHWSRDETRVEGY